MNKYKYETPFDCKWWQKVIGSPIILYECVKGLNYCPGCPEFHHIDLECEVLECGWNRSGICRDSNQRCE